MDLGVVTLVIMGQILCLFEKQKTMSNYEL